MKAPLKKILGQPSWTIRSDRVEAHITRMGGHLAPVKFKLKGRTVQPFSVAPWAEEDIKTIPLLKALRGDFFCLPFGGNGTKLKNEQHPPHGESANRAWKLQSITSDAGNAMLLATMKTTVRPGRILKAIGLGAGQSVVYQSHDLYGFSGPMSIGHHPTLLFPEEPGSGLISVSRFVHGQVYPGAFESPENRGYQSLKPGAIFDSLDRVPLAAGGFTDLSRYPARRGYEDLVMMCADPDLQFAWSAVVFPKQGYVWFSLRDPKVLRSTLFWISNGGRHYSPWNGRHVNVMGIEDVTSYFAEGLAESVKANSITRRGIPTAIELHPNRPMTIAHIMGVADIPKGFDHVADVREVDDGIELRSRSGKRVRTSVHMQWLEDVSE